MTARGNRRLRLSLNKILLLTEDAGIYFCTLCYLSDESLRVEKHYYIFAYVKKAIDLFSRFFVFKKVTEIVCFVSKLFVVL